MRFDSIDFAEGTVQHISYIYIYIYMDNILYLHYIHNTFVYAFRESLKHYIRVSNILNYISSMTSLHSEAIFSEHAGVKKAWLQKSGKSQKKTTTVLAVWRVMYNMFKANERQI